MGGAVWCGEEEWGEETAADEAADADEYKYCDDGDRLYESDMCDDYCDCMGCEDEMDCKDGMGVTRVDLGSVQMNLNLKHDGGKYGVMTTDLIAGLVHCIFSPGDCF